VLEQVIHLHAQGPRKPPEGEPCNGCGVCCALELCPVARLRFMHRFGQCPALTWSPEQVRYHCGLLTNPSRWLPGIPKFAEASVQRLMARWISAGSGCDCEVEAQG
jgi:hypothetical protein